MRLATLKTAKGEIAGVVTPKGVALIETINAELGKTYPTEMLSLIESGQLPAMTKWYNEGGKEKIEALGGKLVPLAEAKYGPLYRNPQKIFGIGLNYVDHAKDLAEVAPNTEPASFFKPATTIIGPGDDIKIPLQSEKTTAESELGVILGKYCKDIEPENWLDYVAGYTTVIDMTTEDILRKNPRYLTRSKSFDTFFSFGPVLVTPDEVPDVNALHVATMYNGAVHAENVVSNMTFRPDFLVAFHSKVMPWLPGDILSTGTPRAVAINQGDVVACRIDGFETLENPVIDLKLQK